MFDMITYKDLGWEDSVHPAIELQLADSLEPSEPNLNGPETIPAGLDEMKPGVFLAAILEHTDIDRLTPHDRVVVLRAQQRMASHHQARAYAAMAAITAAMEQDPDEATWAQEAAAAEIGTALRLTRRAADNELEMALEMTQRLPRVLAALTAGVIDARRARTIVHGTLHLPNQTARDVVDRIIDDAPRLTTGQLAARLRRLCLETSPDEAKDRYERAVADRRVSVTATEAGTANLYGLDLPPHRIAAAMRHVNRLARDLRRDGETRTMDQLRADVVLDLLNGTSTAAPGHGVVDLHIDLTTLMELDERPGELAGFGPLIADIARRVAEHQTRSQWRYTVTDPDSGALLDAGTTRRRPAAAQRRWVEARDRTCVFPGCRAPATGSDLDHTTPHAHAGRTATWNLGPLCRHHHNLKTNHGWTYRLHPSGDHVWTSQLGHTYTTSGRSPWEAVEQSA